MTSRRYSLFVFRCALANITSSSSDVSGMTVFASAVHFPKGHDAASAKFALSISITLWLHAGAPASWNRSEEHTSELQSLMRNSYAVFCLKKKKKKKHQNNKTNHQNTHE